MHRTKVAPLYIILAGCLWGSMGLFVRRLGFMGLDSMGIVELRSILAVILLFAVTALRSPNQLKVTKHNLIPLASSGIFSIIFFNYCYFSTIRLLNLSAAAILLYTAPIFVMLLSIPLFHETLTVRKVLALCMAFAGCCLVSGIASASQRLSLQGILLGLGSGFGYALYSIFSRVSLNQGLGSVTITDYTFLFAALASLPLSGLPRHLEALADWRAILGGLGIGVLCCILPYLLYTEGLRYTEAGKAAILATVEPFVAALLGICLFHESVTFYKLLGMGAIFLAILLLNRTTNE